MFRHFLPFCIAFVSHQKGKKHAESMKIHYLSSKLTIFVLQSDLSITTILHQDGKKIEPTKTHHFSSFPTCSFIQTSITMIFLFFLMVSYHPKALLDGGYSSTS